MRKRPSECPVHTGLRAKWGHLLLLRRTGGARRLLSTMARYALYPAIVAAYGSWLAPGKRRGRLLIWAVSVAVVAVGMAAIAPSADWAWGALFTVGLLGGILDAVSARSTRPPSLGKLRGLWQRALSSGQVPRTSDWAVADEEELAAIDADGFALGHVDDLPDHPPASAEEFIPCSARRVAIVRRADTLAVRKQHRTRETFVRAVAALDRLSGLDFVPRLVDVDFDQLTTWTTYLPGPTLRLKLASCGAKTLDRSFADDPAAPPKGSRERFDLTLRSGRDRLQEAVGQDFVERAFADLQAMHRCGVVWNDLKYGNVIVCPQTHEPRFVDFGSATVFAKTSSLCFDYLCDRDIVAFNSMFGTDKPTRESLRAGISRFSRSPGWYAPVDFGRGVFAGHPWSVSSGTGKWHCVVHPHLPDVAGRRVLDLGCNNGSMDLEMLRHGARAAVGFEISAEAADQAEFVRRGYEWADRCSYDFRVIRGDMTRVCEMDLGRFDVALALCTLYYLEEPDIVRVMRRVAETCDLFLVQSNIDPRHHTGEIARRARPEYLAQRLSESGFSVLEVDAPRGYSRPLIVAKP